MKFKFYYLLIPFFIGILFMTLPYVRHLKNEVKKEVKMKILKRNLNENDLHQFSAKDLISANWTDESEFTLNHFLYDVIFVKSINGEKIYYCFQDQKETKIANIESKIQDFFAGSVLRKTEIKPYFSNAFKINVASKELDKFYLQLSKIHFQKSQFKYYRLLNKSSDFIDQLIIPPEV